VRTTWRFVATVLLLAATLAATRLSDQRKPEPPAMPLESIDSQVGAWAGRPAEALSESALRVLKPSSYLLRVYSRGDQNIGLFVAYYAHQRSGESMHSPKNCLPGSGWEVWDSTKVEVPFQGRQVSLNKYSVQNGLQRMTVLYWYQSRERIVSSEYYGKICLVWDALSSGRTAGSLVRLTIPDQPGAAEEAGAFASLLIPQIQRCLGS